MLLTHGSGECLKARQGGSPFFGAHGLTGGASPWGPMTPIALQQKNGQAAHTPMAARYPSHFIWAPTSKVKHREDTLMARAGVQQISTFNHREQREWGAEGRQVLVPPACPSCLPQRQGELK